MCLVVTRKVVLDDWFDKQCGRRTWPTVRIQRSRESLCELFPSNVTRVGKVPERLSLQSRVKEEVASQSGDKSGLDPGQEKVLG